MYPVSSSYSPPELPELPEEVAYLGMEPEPAEQTPSQLLDKRGKLQECIKRQNALQEILETIKALPISVFQTFCGWATTRILKGDALKPIDLKDLLDPLMPLTLENMKVAISRLLRDYTQQLTEVETQLKNLGVQLPEPEERKPRSNIESIELKDLTLEQRKRVIGVVKRFMVRVRELDNPRPNIDPRGIALCFDEGRVIWHPMEVRDRLKKYQNLHKRLVQSHLKDQIKNFDRNQLLDCRRQLSEELKIFNALIRQKEVLISSRKSPQGLAICNRQLAEMQGSGQIGWLVKTLREGYLFIDMNPKDFVGIDSLLIEPFEQLCTSPHILDLGSYCREALDDILSKEEPLPNDDVAPHTEKRSRTSSKRWR